jgi:uncharacterized protein (UPF0333 family)
MRGQAAIEYMMMLSIVLTILTILTYYAADMTNSNRQEIISSNAVIAVNKIAEAADTVYTQGSSSQITLSVYVPENVNFIHFNNKMVVMEVGTGPYSDIIASSKAPFFDSSISTDSGTKTIVVKSGKNGGGSYVSVKEG